MADSVAFPGRWSGQSQAGTAERTAAIPWYIWCAVLGVTSAMIGTHWDISWHRSIGRDTFWTPAHLAIQLCGVLAAISCGYLIFHRTFSKDPAARAATVKIWGLYGPLGAFVASWGGIAMLTSAPFDDWWHNAYGLDVKIVSPPHVVLILGMLMVQLGTLILVLGERNRAAGTLRRKLDFLFLYVGAMVIVLLMVLTMEFTGRSWMHSPVSYRAVAWTAPIILATLSRASERRWAGTIATGIYSLLLIGLVLVLPLFPAEPKLGPVYREVKFFIPNEFPLLLLVPTFLLDLLWPRLRGWKKWAQAVAGGVVFLASFLAVQWPFASFLMSPASRNWFFGTGYHDYLENPQSYYVRNLFIPYQGTLAHLTWEVALILGIAVLMTRLGLGWGEWMRQVQR